MVIKIVKKQRVGEPIKPPAPLVENPASPAKTSGSSTFGDGWTPGPNDKPRPCKVCGNLYWRPCDGLGPNCIAARWHAQRKAGQQPTLP